MPIGRGTVHVAALLSQCTQTGIQCMDAEVSGRAHLQMSIVSEDLLCQFGTADPIWCFFGNESVIA